MPKIVRENFLKREKKMGWNKDMALLSAHKPNLRPYFYFSHGVNSALLLIEKLGNW